MAYSLYLYGEKNNTSEFRVSDLFKDQDATGVHNEFGISKNDLMKKLRYLSSEANRVIIAELNMGLDHITLRKDLNSISVLEELTK